MDFDRAAMTDDDAVNDGESETRAVTHQLRGKKRLKYMFLDLVAHSHAIVDAFDSYERPRADSKPLRDLDIDDANLRGYGDCTRASTNRIGRVGNQIQQDIPELRRIADHVAIIVLIHEQADILWQAAFSEGHRVIDQSRHPDFFPPRDATMAEGEDVADQAAPLIDGADHSLQALGGATVCGHLGAGHFKEPRHGGKKIVEMVGDTARQPAESFHFQRSPDLRFAPQPIPHLALPCFLRDSFATGNPLNVE